MRLSSEASEDTLRKTPKVGIGSLDRISSLSNPVGGHIEPLVQAEEALLGEAAVLTPGSAAGSWMGLSSLRSTGCASRVFRGLEAAVPSPRFPSSRPRCCRLGNFLHSSSCLLAEKNLSEVETRGQVKDLSQNGPEKHKPSKDPSMCQGGLTALSRMTSQFSQNKFGQHKNWGYYARESLLQSLLENGRRHVTEPSAPSTTFPQSKLEMLKQNNFIPEHFAPATTVQALFRPHYRAASIPHALA